MSTTKSHLVLLLVLLTTLASGPGTRPVPDEGMWPFHDLPLKLLKEKYGFEPSREWLDHLRLASLKISSGGSGSFVSANGLVATNHHVALEFVNKLSSSDSDLVKKGFLARNREQELRCPDATLKQLVSMEDVTARMLKSSAGKSGAQAMNALRQASTALQMEESQRSGLTCEVVTLYGGARYWIYRYKVYDDVRLVFAPEKQVAFFGGDKDNFCYPRFCLDCAFLRAYEDGKPAKTPNYIHWSGAGTRADDLIFISGNPASTGRFETLSQLEFKRDSQYPTVLKLLTDRERALSEYMALGDKQRLEVLDDVFGLRNSIKAYTGMLKALRTQSIWDQLAANQGAFKKALAQDQKSLAAFAAVDAGNKTMAQSYPTLVAQRLNGDLFSLAGRILNAVVRLGGQEGEETEKAIQAITSTRINKVEEVLRLRASLETALAVLGKDDPFVKLALGDASPAAAAKALVAGQRLTDPDFVRVLMAKGRAGVIATEEPLLRIALMRERTRGRLGPAYSQAGATAQAALPGLSKARFRVKGGAGYPDATFTLRLSFGVVKGYELGTTDVPWKTNIWGLYARNSSFDDQPPYNLPQRWKDARARFDLNTPVDFVSTADTTGGNSGSPVVDRKGELVGLLFDGNIQSLLVDNLYEEKVARSVCVDVRYIAEALDKVYDARELRAELGLK